MKEQDRFFDPDEQIGPLTQLPEEDAANGNTPPSVCSVLDCHECLHACISFPHHYRHKNGYPFCKLGRPVEVLSLVQTESLQPGQMKPNEKVRV